MDSEGNPITKDTLVSKLPFQNAQKLIYDSIALSQLDETKLISVLKKNSVNIKEIEAKVKLSDANIQNKTLEEMFSALLVLPNCSISLSASVCKDTFAAETVLISICKNFVSLSENHTKNTQKLLEQQKNELHKQMLYNQNQQNQINQNITNTLAAIMTQLNVSNSSSNTKYNTNPSTAPPGFNPNKTSLIFRFPPVHFLALVVTRSPRKNNSSNF